MTRVCELCASRLDTDMCLGCGRHLAPDRRPDQKYCSRRCLDRMAKRRQRARELNAAYDNPLPEDAFPG